MDYQIVDGNSIGYAAHYGTTLTNAEGMQTQAIFGTIRTLAELRSRNPKAILVVVWDGRAQWRFDECPSYKSNRHSDDPKREAIREAYKAQMPILRKMLSDLGVRQMLCKTHEADDLAGWLVSRKKPEDKMTLITGDRDWLQLVRANVVWKDCKTGNVVGLWNFFEQTGYKTPIAFLEGKCLKGDTSDAIPGVGGIGEKGAPEFLATYGSVENFFNGVDAGTIKPSKKVHQRLADTGREIYRRNYRIMQLLEVAPIKRENLIVTDRTAKNREEFVELCGQMGFASFLSNPDGIMNLF